MRVRMRNVLWLVSVWLAGCGTREQDGAAGGLGVAEALGGSAVADAGFARATAVPSLQFPRDHGAHPQFRTEWWYVTGNVADAAGRRFGVQLVFFRQGLAPPDPAAPPRAGSLAARESMLAHAAVTDVTGGRFHAEERLVRAAGELGYARGGSGPDDPLAVRCADWSATGRSGGDGFLPLALRAAGARFRLELDVLPGEPVVLQGDRGLSQKSDGVGNASIYYSLPRVPLVGRLVVDGVAHDVRGDGWIDREWSTSALGADQVGWDWFSLQLDDGSEVMWYRLRRRDGSVDPWSRGCVVAPDGTVTRLEPAQVSATPAGTWQAADGRAQYPARWQLRATGSAPFELDVTPLLADQELRVLVRYWEGAVAVRGTRAGRPVTGYGYLEMTGYAK